eukprot:COSAG01_NODE_482_length_16412_cov_47.760130_6_plen_88_part_00
MAVPGQIQRAFRARTKAAAAQLMAGDQERSGAAIAPTFTPAPTSTPAVPTAHPTASDSDDRDAKDSAARRVSSDTCSASPTICGLED